ncbi:MAG TPA: carboxypeptidase-like regulatory domain-containing protein [Pirellulaceae bacterium]|jgi:hypothetical protein|nr:carboxypeptidase-like regulatory domain-containing protein [Pirellulaceae bacterium]
MVHRFCKRPLVHPLRLAFATAWVPVLLLTGCGGEFVPATGIVNVDGAPASGATVIFHPASGSDRATGRTDESGRYTLKTSAPGDGARPGEYAVTVVWLEEKPAPPAEASDDPEHMTVAEDRLKGRYAEKSDASPKATVPGGGGELAPIELKTK